LAIVLIAIGVAGLVQGHLKVSPPKSRIGLVLYDTPLWLLVASLLTGAAVLLSVVIDHHDTRDNERWYQHFKRGAIFLGLLLLGSSLISGFLAALVH
jgi:hypothetical protein